MRNVNVCLCVFGVLIMFVVGLILGIFVGEHYSLKLTYNADFVVIQKEERQGQLTDYKLKAGDKSYAISASEDWELGTVLKLKEVKEAE